MIAWNALTPEMVVFMTTLLLFAIGTAGVVLRRNPVSLLMAVEIMLNASILLLVLGSRTHGSPQGQSAALVVLVLGAAEAVLGLSLALAVFRARESVDIDGPQELAG